MSTRPDLRPRALRLAYDPRLTRRPAQRRALLLGIAAQARELGDESTAQLAEALT